jgi:hypothetical protein
MPRSRAPAPVRVSVAGRRAFGGPNLTRLLARRAPPRDPTPEDSDVDSEEEKMSTNALSKKAAKLNKLCEIEGFQSLDDLLSASMFDSVCPAICMADGCDYTTEMEPDQRRGYCEACGGNTVTSALVLAGLI